MLYFAYDGTINGDWASHYAVRLAQQDPDRALEVIHVEEGRLSRLALEERLHLFSERCRMAGVTVRSTVLARGGIFDTLQEHLPPGAETLVLAGTRARERGRGFLAGTVSERLLRARRWNVLALRVVRPGVLGHPRRLLIPVAGRPEGLTRGLPFLRRFAPDAAELHLLSVREVGRFRYRRLTGERAHALLEPSRDYLRRVERELAGALAPAAPRLEGQALVSDDVPKEIVICANRVRADLIFMGASRRRLPERFMYGDPIEQTLRNAPCDVAIYGGLA